MTAPPSADARDGAGRIVRVAVHPLRVALPVVQKTSQGDWPAVEILIVEVETAGGAVGIGEGLCRRGVRGYAALVEDAVVPLLIGRDVRDRRSLWRVMRGVLTGRPGGQLVEAIAAFDIAFWDAAGKIAGEPVHRLLGGMGRTHVKAYASSINWTDDATVEAEVARALALGFDQIKLKLGRPVGAAIERARLVRRLAPDTLLGVDANWAYDVDDALRVGRALADLGYDFFEEPIVPQDRAGYRRLAQHLPIRLAAGESDFVATEALELLADRSIGMIQPDVARSGGITETWRIAELAAAHHTAFAPHVGWSGAVCVAAGLQLAAAAESFRTFECMVFDNPLRDALCRPLVGGAPQLEGGRLPVPTGPGLGVALDREALERFRVRGD